jgi:hypothetical protein
MSGRKISSRALSGITGVQAAARGERVGRAKWGLSAPVAATIQLVDALFEDDDEHEYD